MKELWPKPSMRPVIPQPNFDTMRASVLQDVQSLFCSCCLKIWVSSTCMMRTWFKFLVRVIMVLFFGSTSDSSMMNVSEFLRNYRWSDCECHVCFMKDAVYLRFQETIWEPCLSSIRVLSSLVHHSHQHNDPRHPRRALMSRQIKLDDVCMIDQWGHAYHVKQMG